MWTRSHADMPHGAVFFMSGIWRVVTAFVLSMPFFLLLVNGIHPGGGCRVREAICDLPGTFPATLRRPGTGFSLVSSLSWGSRWLWAATVLPEGDVSLEPGDLEEAEDSVFTVVGMQESSLLNLLGG